MVTEVRDCSMLCSNSSDCAEVAGRGARSVTMVDDTRLIKERRSVRYREVNSVPFGGEMKTCKSNMDVCSVIRFSSHLLMNCLKCSMFILVVYNNVVYTICRNLGRSADCNALRLMKCQTVPIGI